MLSRRSFLLAFPLASLILVSLTLALPGRNPAAAASPSEGEGEPREEEAAPQRGRTGFPLPRFVSLRAGEVNLRRGPGVRYPIDWVFHRRGLPVEILDEYDTWRRIRDSEGTSGWVHQSMLQARRAAIVLQESLLRKEAKADARAIAQVAAGAMGVLESCRGNWCRLTFERYRGWLPRQVLFGAYPDETFP